MKSIREQASNEEIRASIAKVAAITSNWSARDSLVNLLAVWIQ